MTKQEFNSYLDELTSETGFDLTKEQKAFAYQAAKEYHNQALRIHDVVGRSEQFTFAVGKRVVIIGCEKGHMLQNSIWQTKNRMEKLERK